MFRYFVSADIIIIIRQLGGGQSLSGVQQNEASNGLTAEILSLVQIFT